MYPISCRLHTIVQNLYIHPKVSHNCYFPSFLIDLGMLAGNIQRRRVNIVQFSVMQQVNKFIEPLKFQALDRMESLKVVEEKLKIKPSLALLILFVLLLLLSPLLNTHALLTSVVCYLIPAYLSFIALESTDKEDDIRYLTYWIIFSLVQVSSPLFRLFFNKFIYMTFRILVTLALLHPLSSLASFIYSKFVRPFLVAHQQEIDTQMDEVAKRAKKKLAEEVAEGLQKL